MKHRTLKASLMLLALASLPAPLPALAADLPPDGTTAAPATAGATKLQRLAGSAVDDSELADMRAGFFSAAGAQFDFGESVQTLVNGQLALQTNVNWTDNGMTVQQFTGMSPEVVAIPQSALIGSSAPAVGQTVASATIPVVLAGASIPSATGSTEVLANLNAGQLQNITINSASNQTIAQNTNVMLTIYNFADWQQQMTQNAMSNQLINEIRTAAGLGGGH